MDIRLSNLLKGQYVLAVSGGVDSMVLLHLLQQQLEPNIKLTVAHFNHGIRKDSEIDEKLVAQIAKKYSLQLEVGQAHLGKDASEEQARDARYKFLNEVKIKNEADGIIMAHHQDDLIETAIINLLRGTGPRGLVAMQKNKKIIRPLLHVTKREIIKYAEDNNVKWREDITNRDTKHLRNYVRHKLAPKLDSTAREKILKSIDDISKIHEETQSLIQTLSSELKHGELIDRGKFINLPTEIGNELLAYWLRELGAKDLDRKTLHRLSIAMKTAKPGTRHNAVSGLWLQIDSKSARLLTNR